MADLSITDTHARNIEATPTAENLITTHLDIWATAIEQKSSAGRGSSNKFSLYGIKKLRELILELAVRGKLVLQDANDEPASVLLERIAAEKAQLVKEGKLKKQKPLPEIKEYEKPFELPNGWEWSRLGDFVLIIRGITFPSSEKHRELAPFRVACIRTTNVQDSLEWDDLLFVDRSYVKREEQYLKLGDIVMSMANSRELVGKVSFISHIPVDESSFGGFLSVIRPFQFDASFLMSVLRAPLTKKELIGSASQTTNIANISLEKLNPLVIAVPPLEEQHSIVAKVDELMSLCDALETQTEASIAVHQTLVETLLNALLLPQTAANTVSQSDVSLEPQLKSRTQHFEPSPELPFTNRFDKDWQRVAEHFDTLFTTSASIDTLKQIILQLAVMGKLVKQDPNDEPAAKLLERIAKEKVQQIKEGKIKKQKPLPAITDEEKPFVLPQGWEWCYLQDALDVRDGTHDSPKDALGSNTIPLITSKDFIDGEINFENARRISKADHDVISKRSLVEVDDILFSMIGGNIGNQVIVKDARPFSIKNVALFKFIDKSATFPNYIKIFTEELALELQNKASGGAQPFVSLGKLRSLTLGLPPLEEQHRIVAKVDELMALCDQLKVCLADAQITQLHLTDAIVEQAI